MRRKERKERKENGTKISMRSGRRPSPYQHVRLCSPVLWRRIKKQANKQTNKTRMADKGTHVMHGRGRMINMTVL